MVDTHTAADHRHQHQHPQPPTNKRKGSQQQNDSERQPKQHKRAQHASLSSFSSSSLTSIPLTRSHPYQVKPLGNYYLSSSSHNCRLSGLGVLYSSLTEASLLHVLHYCTVNQLCALARVSKAFYVYTHDEELYKQAVLRQYASTFQYKHTWRLTYIYQHCLQTQGEDLAGQEIHQQQQLLLEHPLCLSGFYSDTLFQSFYCSSVDLNHFNNPDTIDRISAAVCTPDYFRTHYGVPNRPVIITGVVNQWPAASWTAESLCARYFDSPFKVGALTMTLSHYLQYAGQCQDESPLYLFDSAFGDKYPEMLDQYSVPEVFKEDLFALLASLPAFEGYNDGCEDRDTPGMQVSYNNRLARTAGNIQASVTSGSAHDCDHANCMSGSSFGFMRPAYRWILIGPARSGSTFHKDPNHTSAWNGLLRGQKRWILYPPNQPPPGVFPSADGRDVVTPISVAEWFVHYYAQHTRRLQEYDHPRQPQQQQQQHQQQQQQQQQQHTNSNHSLDFTNDAYTPNVTDYSGYGPIECVCHPGDLLFIPNGWWHLALNLTASIALTQNFVNKQNLLNVLQFLQQEGNTSLYEAFHQQLQQCYPGLIEKLQQRAEERAERVKQQRQQQQPPSSLWQRMVS